MSKRLILGSLSTIALIAATTSYAATSSASSMSSSSNGGTGANGFFISGFGGTNYLQEQTYGWAADASTDISTNVSYDWGWNTGGVIGIKQNNLEYGLRLTYLDNGIDQAKQKVFGTSYSTSSGSNTGWSYLGTVQYDFHMGSDNKWVPFINGGIGGATMDLKIDGDSKSSTAFAYQIGGGVGYQVNDHLRIFGEYNHLGTTQLSGVNGASDGGDYYYQNNSFIGGLTYYIGNKT